MTAADHVRTTAHSPGLEQRHRRARVNRWTVAVPLLRAPISTTQWWYAIANVLARFGG